MLFLPCEPLCVHIDLWKLLLACLAHPIRIGLLFDVHLLAGDREREIDRQRERERERERERVRESAHMVRTLLVLPT